ncbi:MAG: SdpI family protein [Myxococcales bacterium]|nr:SdpI family protein [Myxococcales bacterium]
MTKSPFHTIIAGASVLAAFAGTAALYPSMPDAIPTHWNIHGEVDGHMSKAFGAFLLPAIALLIFAARLWQSNGIPLLSYVVVFLSIQAIAIDLHAVGHPVSMVSLVGYSLGALFVLMGNSLGKVRRNRFVGIRTPWTLADEEVWLRTHRFGGPVFMMAGGAMLLGTAVGTPIAAVVASLATAVLACGIYSYVVYRSLRQTA